MKKANQTQKSVNLTDVHDAYHFLIGSGSQTKEERIVSIETLLWETDHLLGLNRLFKLSEEETHIVIDFLLSPSFDLKKSYLISHSILLSDQDAFCEHIKVVLSDYQNELVFLSGKEFCHAIHDEIYVSLIRERSGRMFALSGTDIVLGLFDTLGPKRVGRILYASNFNILEMDEPGRYFYEICDANDSLPKSKKLKNVRELETQKVRSFDQAVALIKCADFNKSDLLDKAWDPIFSKDAKDLDLQVITSLERIFLNRYGHWQNKFTIKFYSWAKENLGFFSHHLTEYSFNYYTHILHTADDYKKAVFLLAAIPGTPPEILSSYVRRKKALSRIEESLHLLRTVFF